MVLFARSRPANTMPTIPLMEQMRSGKAQPDTKQGGTESVRSRGGLFGAFMPKSIPRTLQVLGATLQQIENPQGQLDAFSANEADQQRQALVDMAQARTGKLEDQQQGYVDQAIGSLPPEQQPWARLAPEAAARSVFAQQAPPEYQIDANGRPYTIQNGQVQYGQGQVAVRQPGEGGAGRIQYRPVTPQEAQVYNLPGNGAGFVMGSNGRPIRVGGGGSFSPDQRARVEIGFDPALEAVAAMDRLETNGGRSQRRSSPRNAQWGASVVDMVDGEGTGALARNWGGQDFQQYTSAGSAFESGMLPILSGAAVTDSEARRMIRGALPQLGDGPQVLEDKARRRRQMLNGAAIIGGRPPPYPQDAVPAWATSYNNAYGNASAGGEDGPPDGVTQEEWDAMTPEERALFQ